MIKNMLFNWYSLLLSTMVILLVMFTVASCDKEQLDVQTGFPFEVQVMPVPKAVVNGGTVNIICTVKPEGIYEGTQYYIRYFQFDGSGKLGLGPGKTLTLTPNTYHKLSNKDFTLYYRSESAISQSFDVWISDNFGHEKKLSFQFNNLAR